MRSKIYSIRDKKLNVFGRPFFAQDELIAKRGVSVHLRDPENQMAIFATDYEMMELGSFDDGTGKFDLYQFPMHICEMAALKEWIGLVAPLNIKQEVKNAEIVREKNGNA